MSKQMNGYCGYIKNSSIVSNGNFTLRFDSGNTSYNVEYSDGVTNPVVVVSLTSPDPTLTYVLNAYTGGFTLYVYRNSNGTPTPTTSDFNFIVAEIV